VRRTLIIFLPVLAIGMMAAALAAWRSAREPEHDGQPLSAYLRSLTSSQVRLERNARDAIRTLGSNAVPRLIQILDARESRLKTWLNEAANRQSLIRFRFDPLASQQIQAAMACQELGPVAAPAIPSLSRLIDDPLVGYWAVAALAEIGPQNFPLLTNALASRWPSTRSAAVGHLRLVRPRERAVPLLLAVLQDQDSHTRSLAAESIGALGVASPEVIAALAARLDDESGAVCVSAAVSLGWLGAAASDCAPRLVELYRRLEGTPDQWRVGEALKSVDVQAAERAGVK
jgi:HEAT repeat protein